MHVHAAADPGPGTRPDAGRRCLTAAVIGLGVGEQHAIAYRDHDRCRLSVLCDRDADRLAEVAERLPGVTGTTDPDEVFDDPSIDVVSIASYDDVHADQIVRAIGAGKHVFAEKPLCLHERELADIRAAVAERPAVRLGCNLVLRASPRLRRLKSMIDDGRFGTLYHLEGAYDYGRLQKLTRGWRGRLPYYSAMLGGGVHIVDLLLWLTGQRVVEVSAMGNNICSAGAGFAFHDCSIGLVRFESGAVGKISADLGCVLPHGHGLQVYGTEATFINGPATASLFESRDPDTAPKSIDDPHPGAVKGALIGPFLDSILDGTPPPIGVEEILATMSVCLALDRSAREGVVVGVSHQTARTAS